MNTDPTKQEGSPEKTYREELANKGSTFTDTPEESEARDRAKVDQTSEARGQKMDGNNPYLDEDSASDEEIRKETLEKK